MAYYLQWPSSNGWITTPDWKPTEASNWSFEVDLVTPSTVSGDKTIIGQEDSTASRAWKLFINNGNLGIIHNSNWSGGGFIVSSVSPNTRYLVRGEFDGGDIRLFFNDILVASASGRNLGVASAKSHLSAFGRSLSSGASVIGDLALYRAKFFDDATQTSLSLDYDPTASLDQGAFVETESGNNGTPVGFPTNFNDALIFYSDGGSAITVDAAYSVNAPTFTGSASVTLPEPTADASFTLAAPTFTASADASLPQPIADGAFSIASPLFSANADASLPRPIADAAFTLNAPTFSASATATIPGFNASIAYSVNAPTFTADATVTLPSPTADVSYTISAPTFSVDSTVTLPQPTANAAFSLPAPTFAASATATEPNFNASVNFTVNAPTFAVDASATLPQPESSVSFAVSTPSVSVVAIVGGIAIIVDDETNINQRMLSTNINAPILSTNING